MSSAAVVIGALRVNKLLMDKILSWIYRGYSLFLGEYQIYFIECVEIADIFNTEKR